jgi:hypothetical protein
MERIQLARLLFTIITEEDPSQAPTPVWPGTIDGKYYGREQLENFYKPWIELLDKGVGVHCGECGCWKKRHTKYSWHGLAM